MMPKAWRMSSCSSSRATSSLIFTSWLMVAAVLEVQAEKRFELLGDVIEVVGLQAGKCTEPERLVHHHVGVRQLATDPEIPPDHVRLTGQVAGEQQPRT